MSQPTVKLEEKSVTNYEIKQSIRRKYNCIFQTLEINNVIDNRSKYNNIWNECAHLESLYVEQQDLYSNLNYLLSLNKEKVNIGYLKKEIRALYSCSKNGCKCGKYRRNKEYKNGCLRCSKIHKRNVCPDDCGEWFCDQPSMYRHQIA